MRVTSLEQSRSCSAGPAQQVLLSRKRQGKGEEREVLLLLPKHHLHIWVRGLNHQLGLLELLDFLDVYLGAALAHQEPLEEEDVGEEKNEKDPLLLISMSSQEGGCLYLPSLLRPLASPILPQLLPDQPQEALLPAPCPPGRRQYRQQCGGWRKGEPSVGRAAPSLAVGEEGGRRRREGARGVRE